MMYGTVRKDIWNFQWFGCPFQYVGIVVAEHHETQFPTRPVYDRILTDVFLSVGRNIVTLVIVHHGFNPSRSLLLKVILSSLTNSPISDVLLLNIASSFSS